MQSKGAWFLLGSLLVACGVSAQAPVIPAGAVVNGASFAKASDPNGPVAPGTIVAVFGSNLSGSLLAASSVPLSTNLNGTSITFNGTPAPLFFVSGGQVNLQVPIDVPTGTVNVVATNNGQASAAQTVTVATYSPGIFSLNQSGSGMGAILLANSGTFAQPVGAVPGRDAAPVAKGGFIVIFCTGLGSTNPAVPSGTVAPSTEPLARTSVNPTVTIGGITVDAAFSGLAPGFVGLYQVNAQVPANAPSGGAVNLQLTIGGVVSNVVTIAIQ